MTPAGFGPILVEVLALTVVFVAVVASAFTTGTNDTIVRAIAVTTNVRAGRFALRAMTAAITVPTALHSNVMQSHTMPSSHQTTKNGAVTIVSATRPGLSAFASLSIWSSVASYVVTACLR